MDFLDLFERLAAALAIGLLVGLERGWHERDEPEGERSFGLRTFALAGLLGGVWGALVRDGGPAGLIALAIAFTAYGGVALLFRLREVQREGTLGATTMMAALLVFGLGAMATLSSTAVATAAGVAVAGILALKTTLHAALRRVTWAELRAILVLLTMTLVLLPLLPNRGYGPAGAINPREIWLLTILIAATSFAGYLAVRLIGDRVGIAVSSLAAGLVSSTAVTIAMAERTKEQPESTRLLMGGAILAGAVSLLRVLVFAGLMNVRIVEVLIWLLLPALAVVLGFAVWSIGGHAREGAGGVPVVGNPFDLRAVLTSGALLAAIMSISVMAATYVGSAGLIAVAALSGVADVDAMTLSLARQTNSGLSLGLASAGILTAVGVNMITKIALAASAGGRAAARPLLLASGAAFLAACVGGLLSLALGLFPSV